MIRPVGSNVRVMPCYAPETSGGGHSSSRPAFYGILFGKSFSPLTIFKFKQQATIVSQTTKRPQVNVQMQSDGVAGLNVVGGQEVYVNGVKVARQCRLECGDTLRVGKKDFTYLSFPEEKREPRLEIEAHLLGKDLYLKVPLEPRVALGRHPSSDVQVLSRLVSKEQAIISYKVENDGFYIEDNQSRNGTFVNGVRIDKQTRLYTKDKVGFGPDVVFEFSVNEKSVGEQPIIIDGCNFSLYAALLALEYGNWVSASGARVLETFHVNDSGEIHKIILPLAEAKEMERKVLSELAARFDYPSSKFTGFMDRTLFGQGMVRVAQKDCKGEIGDWLGFIPVSVLIKLLVQKVEISASSDDGIQASCDPRKRKIGLEAEHVVKLGHEIGHYLAWISLLTEAEKASDRLYAAYHGLTPQDSGGDNLSEQEIPQGFQALAKLLGADNGQWIDKANPSYRSSFYEYLAFVLESFFMGGPIIAFEGAKARNLEDVFSFLLASRVITQRDIERYQDLYQFRYGEAPKLSSGVERDVYWRLPNNFFAYRRGTSPQEEAIKLHLFEWQQRLGTPLNRLQEIMVRVGKNPLNPQETAGIKKMVEEEPEKIKEFLTFLGQKPPQDLI